VAAHNLRSELYYICTKSTIIDWKSLIDCSFAFISNYLIVEYSAEKKPYKLQIRKPTVVVFFSQTQHTNANTKQTPVVYRDRILRISFYKRAKCTACMYMEKYDFRLDNRFDLQTIRLENA